MSFAVSAASAKVISLDPMSSVRRNALERSLVYLTLSPTRTSSLYRLRSHSPSP